VFAYDAIHAERPDAVVTTNNACITVYEYDRMLVDLLLARSHRVERRDLDAWISDRRRRHYALQATPGVGEDLLRRAGARLAPMGRRADEAGSPPGARRARGQPYERPLDVLGIDWYDRRRPATSACPATAPRRPHACPARQLWDDPPDPGALTRWLGVQHELAPGLPLWVVENGLCNRVRDGRSFGRLDGGTAPLPGREPGGCGRRGRRRHTVEGYWHWSLVDNYEWGSYEPRFGLYGVDRHRGPHGGRWLDTDAMGRDAAGAYRQLIAGIRSGDRTVLVAD